jgi:hypothetical protein
MSCIDSYGQFRENARHGTIVRRRKAMICTGVVTVSLATAAFLEPLRKHIIKCACGRLGLVSDRATTCGRCCHGGAQLS